MKKKPATSPNPKSAPLYKRIREILESARASASRSVNTTHVVANWMVGREIVEDEQKGRRRADYGKRLLESLAQRLREDYGPGYSLRNLRFIRQFYIEYPGLVPPDAIRYALRTEFGAHRIVNALRTELSDPRIANAPRAESAAITRGAERSGILHALRGSSRPHLRDRALRRTNDPQITQMTQMKTQQSEQEE